MCDYYLWAVLFLWRPTDIKNGWILYVRMRRWRLLVTVSGTCSLSVLLSANTNGPSPGVVTIVRKFSHMCACDTYTCRATIQEWHLFRWELPISFVPRLFLILRAKDEMSLGTRLASNCVVTICLKYIFVHFISAGNFSINTHGITDSIYSVAWRAFCCYNNHKTVMHSWFLCKWQWWLWS